MVDTTGLSRLFDMLQSNPSKEVEMRSRRFWRMFGVNRRTDKTIENVQKLLKSQGVQITSLSNQPFGKEDNQAFLRFKHFSVVFPSDYWFDELKDKKYESETEVLFFFIYPILINLGYSEEDFSFHRVIKLRTTKGSRRTRYRMARKIPDLVLYNGSSRSQDNALVIVETKMFTDDAVRKGERLNQAVGDVRYYWITLHPKSGVATDGDQVIVFDPRDQPLSDTYLSFYRTQLKENWVELTMLLSKQALIE